MSENNINKIDVLFTGYSYADKNDDKCMHANCSCTLVQTVAGTNIIVDTMTAWDGKRIIAELETRNLQPDDIDYVVCTHGHSDHIGCNYLFPQAIYHIVGDCVSRKNFYYDYLTNVDEFPLDDLGQVVVVKTPGHTLNCVTVLVSNSEHGCTAICGDLFERHEDIMDSRIWLDAGSQNVNQQKLNRLKVAKLCNYIIPGHGPGFPITHEILAKLREDARIVPPQFK